MVSTIAVTLASYSCSEPGPASSPGVSRGPGGSEIGTRGFDHPDQGDGMRLWHLGLKIPAEQQRTYQGRGELIDHIFVSHALLGGLGEVTTHDVGEGSIGDTPDERDGDPASDHRPVTAELNPSA